MLDELLEFILALVVIVLVAIVGMGVSQQAIDTVDFQDEVVASSHFINDSDGLELEETDPLYGNLTYGEWANVSAIEADELTDAKDSFIDSITDGFSWISLLILAGIGGMALGLLLIIWVILISLH